MSGVTKRTLGKIGCRQIEICTRRNDHRVLAAGLGGDAHAGLPPLGGLVVRPTGAGKHAKMVQGVTFGGRGYMFFEKAFLEK